MRASMENEYISCIVILYLGQYLNNGKCLVKNMDLSIFFTFIF